MARGSRIKDVGNIFHIIIRSIKEVPMFILDADKDIYLSMIRDYQKIFGFKVYAYCLMPNHGHFIIDTSGADISKIMHCINFKYAQYYNKKHNRYGHLFQDRFRSKPVSNRNYLYNLSGYIHNNPKGVAGYETCPENYKYSSLPYFLGKGEDSYGIVDKDFTLNLLSENKSIALKRYIEIVLRWGDVSSEYAIKFAEEAEFMNEKTLYKSCNFPQIRNIDSSAVMKYVSESFCINERLLHFKNIREITNARAFAVILMRGVCNFRCIDICRELGNITEARVSALCSQGIELLKIDPYKILFEKFLLENCQERITSKRYSDLI